CARVPFYGSNSPDWYFDIW
nr:immunoglobulin heavy chain junction region [Macaca mulatta]